MEAAQSQKVIQLYFSYSPADQKLANGLREKLVKYGYSIFMPDENIMPGENWESALSDTLESVDGIIFLITVSNYQTEKTKFEMELAIRQSAIRVMGEHSKILIPLIEDGLKIPEMLQNYQFLKIKPQANLQELADKIHQSIQSKYFPKINKSKDDKEIKATTKIEPQTEIPNRDKIFEIQKTLKSLNFFTGLIDGQFGTETRQAIFNFQSKYKLEGNGDWNTETANLAKKLFNESENNPPQPKTKKTFKGENPNMPSGEQNEQKTEAIDTDQETGEEPRKHTVSEVFSDSASHEIEDQLGFEEDVLALASVIAYREVKPPLAIGLFGNWGSGKSFL